MLYKYPYYISVAHGTYFRDCPEKESRCNGRRYYTTYLILMTIEPQFKILYVSGNIPFPEVTFNVPLVRYRFIESSFFFPVGLILENEISEDIVILGDGKTMNDSNEIEFVFLSWHLSTVSS